MTRLQPHIQRSLRSQAGFTVMETMLAMGLAGLVMVGVWLFYTTFTKQIHDLSEEIEIGQDLESTQRIMLRDLKSIDVCFGTVRLEDDFGKQFFEVFPDVPADELHSSIKVNDPDDPEHPAKRQITLKAGGRMEITLLLHDPRPHLISTLSYTPSWAYNMSGAMPTFVGVNNGNWLKTLRDGDCSQGQGFWCNGNLLMFDVPAVFRNPAHMTASLRALHAPRPPFFVGRVDGAAFNVDPQVQAIVHTTHPITGASISSAHEFLWNLPSVAGGLPNVRVRPVRLVKYQLELMNPSEKDPKKVGLVRLWRWAYTGSWNPNKNRFLVAEKLRSVQFRRNSVTEKTVLFDLSRQELD